MSHEWFCMYGPAWQISRLTIPIKSVLYSEVVKIETPIEKFDSFVKADELLTVFI
jgi:hypothetical protein